MRGTVLVTGGAGYIGSHTCIELLREGYEAVVVDNMVNAVQGDNHIPVSLERVQKIAGKKITFYNLDVREKDKLEKVKRILIALRGLPMQNWDILGRKTPVYPGKTIQKLFSIFGKIFPAVIIIL